MKKTYQLLLAGVFAMGSLSVSRAQVFAEYANANINEFSYNLEHSIQELEKMGQKSKDPNSLQSRQIATQEHLMRELQSTMRHIEDENHQTQSYIDNMVQDGQMQGYYFDSLRKIGEQTTMAIGSYQEFAKTLKSPLAVSNHNQLIHLLRKMNHILSQINAIQEDIFFKYPDE